MTITTIIWISFNVVDMETIYFCFNGTFLLFLPLYSAMFLCYINRNPVQLIISDFSSFNNYAINNEIKTQPWIANNWCQTKKIPYKTYINVLTYTKANVDGN